MIEPGKPLEIEASGETFTSVVLSRRQQRSLIGLVSRAAKLETRVESIDELYDIADEIVDICLPTANESIKDRLQIKDVLAIANEVMLAHILDGEDKKKSESQPT